MAFEEEFGIEIPDDAAENINHSAMPLNLSKTLLSIFKLMAIIALVIGQGLLLGDFVAGLAQRALVELLSILKCFKQRNEHASSSGNGSWFSNAISLWRFGHLDQAFSWSIGRGKITRFDPLRVTTKYACEVPFGDGADGTFNPDDWMEQKNAVK